MKSLLLTTAVAFAAISSTPAAAQQPCQRDNTGRIVGTVAGGGAGALLGSAIAGGGDKRLGAVIGAVGGAILGNQVAKGSGDGSCDRALGYYDSQGRWNATGVSRDNAQGYYDRNGRWVNGVPNGYYDQSGRWVAVNNSVDAAGYQDRNGNWVPASASGYFDSRNRWVEAAAPGRYDSRGRWIPGPTTGTYDARGRFIPNRGNSSQPGQGNWVSTSQPGYYDDRGRWVRGETQGYYNAQGRWVSVGQNEQGRRSDSYGYQDASGRWIANTNQSVRHTGYYDSNNRWIDGQPPRSVTGMQQRDLQTRYENMEQRLARGLQNGSLDQNEYQRAMYELNSIKARDARVRGRNGEISSRNEAALTRRLDRLGSVVREARNEG